MNDVKIAIYIRLSMADEETGKSRDESNSIYPSEDADPSFSGYAPNFVRLSPH